MADTVSFKVFVTKEEDSNGNRPEVRRFGIDKDVVTNFLYLSEKLQNVFPALRSRHFTVSWKDGDGDNIVISSDEELKIALSETLGNDIRKLYVTLHSEYPEGCQTANELSPRTLHVGITCDGCNNDVQGFRYKCIQCPDFDLCADCEGKGLHPEHCMIRSAVPLQWRPHFGRRLAHHMNKFARKTGGHCPGKDSKEASECPYKRGKFHHGNGGGHHGGGGSGHNRRPSNMDRPSWLDSLATYLNDWGYLAGEGDCPMRDQSSGEDSNSEKHNENGGQEQQKGANPHAELFKNIGDNLASLLDPLGINVEVLPDDQPASSSSANENGQAKPQAQNTAPAPSTSKFPGEGKKLVEKTPAAPSNSFEKTADNASPPSAKPSIENEGWTLLNQQDTAVSAASVPAETSGNGAIPKQSSMNVPAASPSTLASAPASALIYPQLPEQAVEIQPIIYHPDPKIQRSIIAMMQMGFSNEGGWLTQLLASKNGDISKVLDILQPVRPTANRQQ